MPKEGKKKRDAPMPMTGAGLVRFFEEDTQGVKIRPEIIVVMTVALITLVIMARVLSGLR